MAEFQMKLKLLIDTKVKKVLFAEAEKDFIDFLFYLLSLPISTVIRILENQGDVGSLKDLYNSLQSLNDTYMLPGQNKTNLLHHTYSLHHSQTPLLLSGGDQQSKSTPLLPQQVYMCTQCRVRASKDCKCVCPQCHIKMTAMVSIIDSSTSSSKGEGGFVKGSITYMVMDNLEVKPISTIASITILKRFNVENVCTLDEKDVVFGANEALKLLKASMVTKNVLTSVFLGDV